MHDTATLVGLAVVVRYNHRIRYAGPVELRWIVVVFVGKRVVVVVFFVVVRKRGVVVPFNTAAAGNRGQSKWASKMEARKRERSGRRDGYKVRPASHR